MAEQDTPTTAHSETAAPSRAATDDPVALIEDNIVRRLVRVAVHVRGYAPYYAATVAFGLMLLLVPGLGGDSDDPGAVATGVTGGTPDASTSTTATRSPSPSSTPAELAGANDFFTEQVTTEATRTSSSAPSFSFDDFDYDSDGGSGSPAADQPDETQKPCYVEPPSGAPVSPVSPDRETRNVQETGEALVGQEAPGDASEPVRSVEEAAGQCDDDTGTQSTADVPSTPVTTEAPAVDDDTVVHLVGNMFVF